MTHDELLETIDFLPLDGLHAWMQPALREVVKLHKPTVDKTAYEVCEHCDNQGWMRHMNMPYPCPTIQAIEKELE